MRALVFLIAILSAFAVRADELPSFKLEAGAYSADGSSAIFGIKVSLPSGWHSYWTSPGEAGLPPELSVSDGVRVFWPVPERFSSGGVEAVGYSGSFVAPVVVKAATGAGRTDLSVRGTLYACSHTCVPFRVDLRSSLERGTPPSGEVASWIARIPKNDDVHLTVRSVQQTSKGYSVSFETDRSMIAPQAFLDLGVGTPARLVSMTVEGKRAEAVFEVLEARPSAGPVDVPLVVTDGITALSATVPAETPIELPMMLVALLGGLILNAMPCVFPVLAVKILMIVSKSAVRQIAVHASSAAGIVTAFAALAVAVGAMKLSGQIVGWGMQFQSPLFTGTMALVVMVLGLSLLGFFSIILPSTISTGIVRSTEGGGLKASFVQGLVLTLLATPCSAPFVGTAVGYALSRGMTEILCIFVAMGVGMALPFLVLAVVPGAARLLPRPGKWMLHVKTLAATTLMASSAWLASLSSPGLLLPLLLLVAAACAVVAFVKRSGSWPAVVGAATFAAVGAFMALPRFHAVPDTGWVRFDARTVAAAVADGKTVSVDVTAEWCLTCKVNERGILADPEVRSVLERVVAVRGDWTKPDPEISKFLSAHGRYGIPFYLVVGPGIPEGTVLSELPSKFQILEVIKLAIRS